MIVQTDYLCDFCTEGEVADGFYTTCQHLIDEGIAITERFTVTMPDGKVATVYPHKDGLAYAPSIMVGCSFFQPSQEKYENDPRSKDDQDQN